MFTLRRKEKDGNAANKRVADKHQQHRHSLAMSFDGSQQQQQHIQQNFGATGPFYSYDDRTNAAAAIKHRRQRSRNSLLIGPSTTNDESLIHFMLGPGCFRELRRSNSNNNGSMYSLNIYNLICSLLVFAIRVLNNPSINGTVEKDNNNKAAFNHARKHSTANEQHHSHSRHQQHQQPVTLLLEAPKVPLKALRIVLRACQSALAYRIRQCVLVEPDTFLGFQQRVAKDLLLLDAYDFKIVLCPRQKLGKHIALASLYDLQQIWQQQLDVGGGRLNSGQGQQQRNEYSDLKKGFLQFFSANPSYFANNPTACAPPQRQMESGDGGGGDGLPASLSRFVRKDRTILIELVEFDLDSVFQCQATPNHNIPATIDRRESSKTLRPPKNIDKWNGENGCESKPAAEFKVPNIKKEHLRQQPPHQEAHLLQDENNNNHDNHHNNGLAKEEQEKLSQWTKAIQKALGWLGQHGERRLVKLEADLLAELESPALLSGVSIELTKLESVRTELATESEKILAELVSISSGLDAIVERHRGHHHQQRPTEVIAAGQLLQGAQQRGRALRQGLDRLTRRLDAAMQFRAAASQSHSEANALLLHLCNSAEEETRQQKQRFSPAVPSGQQFLNADKIQAKIGELRDSVRGIEKWTKQATETGSQLCALLRQQSSNNEQEEGQQQEKLGRDKLLALEKRIGAELASVAERRRRCAALVELRIGRLSQRLEIIKCEQFGDQILERFNTSLKTNNAKLVEELLSSRRNGKTLVDYARQMAHLSGMLRKINRLEPEPSEQFTQRLETCWRMLERKYGGSGGIGGGGEEGTWK